MYNHVQNGNKKVSAAKTSFETSTIILQVFFSHATTLKSFWNAQKIDRKAVACK